MQCRPWHLAGAAILWVSLLLASPLQAQNCPDCPANAVGRCQANDCFRPVGPCQGKGCYNYRPFTESSQPDLFYNLYVPNNLGSAAAAYPAPYPTPNHVGHTYYTYQPLMPHEMLYKHRRSYRQYYNGGMGLNRTTVHWGGTPVRTALRGVGKYFSLPR